MLTQNPRTRGHTKSIPAVTGLVSVVLAASLFTGCFQMSNGKTFGMGTEGSTRANATVYTQPTSILYAVGSATNVDKVRDILLTQMSGKMTLPHDVWTMICQIGGLLCAVGLPKALDIVQTWFRDDVKHRNDLWDSLKAAAADNKCWAWTFVSGYPGNRNFTEKSVGTSTCQKGHI